jgi:hypothetical protein
MTVGCFSLHFKFIHYSEINLIVITDNHSFAGVYTKKRGGDLKINEFYIALTELFLSKTLRFRKDEKRTISATGNNLCILFCNINSPSVCERSK